MDSATIVNANTEESQQRKKRQRNNNCRAPLDEDFIYPLDTKRKMRLDVGRLVEMDIKRRLNEIDLYYITDSFLINKGLIHDVESALRAGVGIVQYREKKLSREEAVAVAHQIRDLTLNYNSIFIVNDWPGVARQTEADGVHLGPKDASYAYARRTLGDEGIIGISTNSLSEALESEKEGADYIGFGPIYPSSTKPDARPATGLQELKEVLAAVKIPVVPIGGITEKTLPEVLSTGVQCAAIISDVYTNDVGSRVKNLREIILKLRKT